MYQLFVLGGFILGSLISAGLSLASAADSMVQTKSEPFHLVQSLVLDRNLAIKSAREKWQASMQRIPQAKSFPDPMLGFVTMTEHLQTRAGPMKEKYMVSQKIPFYGKRKLKGNMAEEQAHISEQFYRSKSLDVLAKSARAYYEIFYLDNVIRVNEELADQVRHFARVAERKYAVGGQSQTSVFRAQVELAKILNELITLKQERSSSLANLNALLDRPARTEMSPEGPKSIQWRWQRKALEKTALQRRPEILAARAIVHMNESGKTLAIREFFPDLTLGYDYSVIDGGTSNSAFDGKDAQAVQFNINLPIWYNRQVPKLREAKSELDSAKSTLRDWENQTLFEIEDRSVKVETAKRLVDLYKDTVLPQAEEALKSSQRGYEADRVQFLDLLDSVRSLLKFQQEFYRSQADYAQRKAELERVIGEPLAGFQEGGSHEK